MSDVRVVQNHKGFDSLLKSEEVQGMLMEYGDKIAGQIGGKAEIFVGRTRASCTVRHKKGRGKDNKLLKAMRASRR